MNFILPLVSTFVCETEYTKYFKETEKLFFYLSNCVKTNNDKLIFLQIRLIINKYLQKGKN